MDEENVRHGMTAVVILLGLLIGGAVVWDMISPNSHFAKAAGFVAFGGLCIFLRALPRKFLIPLPKK
jgi:hypothetical protein